MPRTAERVYVDACVFVNVLSGGGSDPQEQEWLPHGTWLLEEGQAGRVEITTSPLTIAEVLGQGKIRGAQLPRAQREGRVGRARAYFADNDITYVELDQSLGDAAAELAVRLQLHGPDGVHLASALASNCTSLYTWDRDLLQWNQHHLVGGLAIVQPEITGQLRLDT